MDRAVLREKLHLSGIDSHAAALARRHGLGFEVTAFCQAVMLEDADARAAAEAEAAGLEKLGSMPPLPSFAPAPSTRWCGGSRRSATARPSPWPVKWASGAS